MALVSAQRAQTLHSLSTDNIIFEGSSVAVLVGDLLKQTSPKNKLPVLRFNSYPEKSLCVRYTLEQYLSQTQKFRMNRKLFISFVKPRRSVTRHTISRWIKPVLKNAGIDVQVYKAHSTRSASSSAALRAGVNLKEIMSKAGWKNAKTFEQFYNKDVNVQNFSPSVFNCASAQASLKSHGVPLTEDTPNEIGQLNETYQVKV